MKDKPTKGIAGSIWLLTGCTNRIDTGTQFPSNLLSSAPCWAKWSLESYHPAAEDALVQHAGENTTAKASIAEARAVIVSQLLYVKRELIYF